MAESDVAIVGAGIVGIMMAHLLTQRGHTVTIFEKGGEFPYPHFEPFRQQRLYHYENPAYDAPPDLKGHTKSGLYLPDIEVERAMRVGGSATHWEGITLRMTPEDFKTRSLFGYGADWPIAYPDLEPYYCQAEGLIGVSGTDQDNPFAPPRSQPFPLPPFELSHDDRLLAERLAAQGMALHTTPQARARLPYDGRPACQNYGACQTCPIGARYSPNHLLNTVLATGRCFLRTGVSVRRVVVEPSGAARALLVQPNDSRTPEEHAAKVIIVAAGALESARLLLLSSDGQRPDGVGNAGGQVGANLTFHCLWGFRLRYAEALYPGRFGGWTGQSHQFINAPTRGRHAAVKVEFTSRQVRPPLEGARSAPVILRALREMAHWRPLVAHSESVSTEQRRLTLSTRRDRHGDPFAHLQYGLADIDHETYAFARQIADRFAQATGAADIEAQAIEHFDSGGHHMGTCRMGTGPADSVTDSFGKVHGTRNLFVVGGSNFVGTSGAMNPTLTMTALALRAAEYIAEQGF